MTRCLAFASFFYFVASLGFVHANAKKDIDKDFRFQGKLTKDDPRDQRRGGPSAAHTVKLKAGKTYTIDMVSSDFDSYLFLEDAKGAQLAEDDDSGGMLNARIMFTPTRDGDYRVVTTTFGVGMGGAYTLTVKASGTASLPSTAHSLMVGKPAPDFSADHAINGKPAKLADMKDKIVLLYFWEVRSSSSAALLPKMAELEKSYKAKGLEIVGITFYPSDISQALAFDAEAGAVKTVKKADRQSDRAMMDEFAKYHKVTHPLMTLPKDDALKTFDAYAVNGLPQVVIIDRKGIVRAIDVAGEKGGATIDAHIKKLLEDK